MAVIAVAGIGMMICCSSSSVAALMMGGSDDDDSSDEPFVPKTPAPKKTPEQKKADEAKVALDALKVDPSATPADIVDAQNEADNAAAVAAAVPPPPPTGSQSVNDKRKAGLYNKFEDCWEDALTGTFPNESKNQSKMACCNMSYHHLPRNDGLTVRQGRLDGKWFCDDNT